LNGIEFNCKCGKFRTWLYENKWTKPCPNCGKKYYGVYSRRKLSIVPKKKNFL